MTDGPVVTVADREAAVRVNNLAARLEPDQILQMPVSVYRAALAAVRAEGERHKEDHAQACVLVARMHAAAVGEVRGPTRGVVEDVEDVRARVTALEGALRGYRAGHPSCGPLGQRKPNTCERCRTAEDALAPGVGGV